MTLTITVAPLKGPRLCLHVFYFRDYDWRILSIWINYIAC